MGSVSSSPRIHFTHPNSESSILHQNFSDFYELGPEIGVGSFAAVHKCHRKEDPSQEFAVKIINKRYLSTKELSGLRDEIAILKKVSHRNVIALVDVFDDGKKVFMVLELCDGKDLFDEIVSSKRNQFCERRAAQIMYSLSNALQYLHSHRVVHRDLKPENILFGMDGTLKITDFGLAHYSWSGEKENVEFSVDGDVVMSTCCGTPHYVAPEIISKKEYTDKCDVWSLGVILYVMLVGYQPFNGDSLPDIYRLIARGKYNFKSKRWHHVSKEAKHLIECMLTVDPKKRLDAVSVQQHPWIQRFVSASSLQKVPEQDSPDSPLPRFSKMSSNQSDESDHSMGLMVEINLEINEQSISPRTPPIIT